MKHFMLRSLMLLSLLCSTWGIGSAWAQLTSLEVGKVYHFTNAKYSDKALAATYPNSVAGVAVDEENKSQLWYVAEKTESGYYALRNLAFGTYLQGNGQSSRWTLASTTDSNNSWITLETAGGNNAFKGYTYGGYGYAHIDGSSNVVGWESGATATQWTITPKDMSDEDIQNALNIFNSVPTIQEHLDNLFSDKSCTTLKGAFDENDASFKALPTTLQAMVRKVAGNTSWEEANSDNSKAKWDAEYAKKYRVQLYEPYNEPECAAKALRINAHTNLNNPTGIFAKKGDILYVMVEGSIEPGATLYLSYYKGHDRLAGATDGYELKQGLNIIPVYYDESNFCVNYVVNTFDTSKGYGSQAKAHRLSDYDPIKIHIEGGYINGYWNKMGDDLYTADTDEDWNYIEARATQQDVVVLGKYMTLKFPLLSVHAENHTAMSQIYNEKIKVSESINEWDNIMLWERFVMGLSTKADLDNSTLVSPYSDKKIFEYTGEDYTDYYNVHGLAYSIESSKNPHGGWDYTGYPNNSMVNINADIFTNAGAHWTAGHEIGHQHQGPLNMRGLTEVTNNLFSNVVLWCFGKSTSRYNGTNGSLTNVLQQFNAEGTDFFSNNIWAQTIMYYKLFLYYHVLGHNTQFYPRLYEMLRQNPMIIEGDQDGSKCLMHFYKLCCEAAGEDLTEFFRAHGFFEVMNSRFVGDYSNATYNLTQAQIDQAITEVKAKGYPKNLAVLFINDATGEEILSHKGGTLELYNETRTCSEIGSYSNFNSDATNYTYSVTGNSVTMEGSGGVGFAILNEKGELIGFSDKKTFDISAEAAAAITSGKVSIVTLNADNTPVAATNVMDTDNTEAKYELLGELLGSAKQLLDLSDETRTKVGYYRVSSLTNLQEAYESAKAVYDAQTIATYSAMYDVLYQEYANLLNNEYARINITEGYAYSLTNKAYPDRSMAVNTENNQMLGIATAESDAQLWYFEAGATPGTYYLKNKATGLYPGDVSTGAVLNADKSDKTTDNGAHAYHLQNMGNGVFALVGKTGLHCSASQSYNIVGWEADDDATQWYITAEVVDETLEARLKLEETIAKTEALVNEMAEVKIKGSALDLTTCTITSNTPETGHETKYLVDGNPGTFFHTNWTGVATSENHNFIIDLGEGNSLEQFAFNYITLPNSAYNVDAPKAMVIEGSTNGTDYTSITSLSGLPTTKGATYASATLGTKGTAYRYLRFSVTDATGGKLGDYYYFGLAEFGLTNMQTELLSVKDGYSTSQTAILNACNGLDAANLVYNNETATPEKLEAAVSALNVYYEALLNAYNAVKEAGLEAKKTELQTLIKKTNELIGLCGEVTYTPAMFNGKAPLQVTDANGKFYLSTNAQSKQEGPISGLIDGNSTGTTSNTYFHTDYSGTNSSDGLDHYINVNLGVQTSDFEFTYTNRPNTESNYATEMTVLGSTDGTTYEAITSLTDLPAQNGATYTKRITTNNVYSYLRFMVTKNSSNTKKGGHYFFHMAEFDLTLIGGPETYTAQLNQNIGDVTDDILIAAYKENEEAKSTFNYATTELQVINAIANLQAQYEALEAAKNNAYKQELSAQVVKAKTLLATCGNIENGEVVKINVEAGDATKEMLLGIHNQIAEAEALINTGTATQSDYETATTNLVNACKEIETAQTGTKRSTLRKLTEDMADLITLCGTKPGDVTDALLTEMTNANKEAIALLSTDDFDGITNTTETLTEKFKELSAAQQSTAKAELRAEIKKLEDLINECSTNGTKTITTDVPCALQTSNGADFYISTNATVTEGDIANLVDGKMNTSFQTKNSVGAGAVHYLLVDAGDGNALKKFKFSYRTNKSFFPYTIVVEGSNDNSGFRQLAIFSKDDAENPLPTNADQLWTSSEIVSEKTAYRYLRFNVTKSGVVLKINDNKEIITDEGEQLSNKYKASLYAETPQGEYCFAMSEFDLINRVDVEGVTEDQITPAETAIDEANALAETSADATALSKKKGALEKLFNDLNVAYLAASQRIQVTLTTTDAKRDELLSGIEFGQTIGTFSAPYPTVIPEGVTAYYAQQEYNGGTVSLTPIEKGEALPAEQGVILIGEVGVNSVMFIPATDETEADLSLNKFSNSATGSVEMEDDYYILAMGDHQGIGFYRATPGSILKQGKAFFRILDPNIPLSFVLRFDGNTTDIDAVTTGTPSDDELIYDIYGRRVTEVKKGNIYIKNGKKFFVK